MTRPILNVAKVTREIDALYRRHRLRAFCLLPLALLLYPLVCLNFWRRQHGLGPDEWYWADTLIMKYGWIVTKDYRLERALFS